MGILDSVLRYKEAQQARQDALANELPNSIANAANTFLAAKQQAQDNQFKMLTLGATLNAQGATLGRDANGNYVIQDNPNSNASMIKKLQAQQLQSQIGLNNQRSQYLQQKPQMDQQKQQDAEVKRQDALEKNYLNAINTTIRTQRGQYGLQNQMVESAFKGIDAMENYRDPQTGELKIPPALHTEVAMSAARLLSGTSSGAISERMVDELKQKTAKEQLKQAEIWLGMDPKQAGGTTASNAQFLYDTLKRLGVQAQEGRDKSLKDAVGLVPIGLEPSRYEKIQKTAFGRDFIGYVNSLGSNGSSQSDGESKAIPEGATGTYQGKAVVRRGGKWQIA